MIRHTVHFTGRVQGVGFRYTTTRISRSFDVTGYVRNLPDGRVQLVAEGDTAQVNAFIDEIKRRMNPYITAVQRDSGAATGEFEGFDVRY